jgi:hypothetical protein
MYDLLSFFFFSLYFAAIIRLTNATNMIEQQENLALYKQTAEYHQ